MAILDVLRFPDERLRTVASQVDTVDDEIKKLVDDMFETMRDERGIGLAATQVNVHKRVVVMDVSEEQNEQNQSRLNIARANSLDSMVSHRHTWDHSSPGTESSRRQQK